MYHSMGEVGVSSPSGPQDQPNLQSTLVIRSCIEHPNLHSNLKHRHQAEQMLGACMEWVCASSSCMAGVSCD